MPEKIKECFVIMPISDAEGYENGHFSRVYEDLIKPAVEYAGYKPYRADENKSSDLIHLDILKKILEAPMAVCDLSSRNPNVLFELGIRQAFNKPVVLIKDECTNRIFDVDLIRYTEYSKNLKYRDVVNKQEEIKNAIIETSKGNRVNSIIKLLSIDAAQPISLTNEDKDTLALEVVGAKIDYLFDYIKSHSLYQYNIFTNKSVKDGTMKNIENRAIRLKDIEQIVVNTAKGSEEDPKIVDTLNQLWKEAITVPEADKIKSIYYLYKSKTKQDSE